MGIAGCSVRGAGHGADVATTTFFRVHGRLLILMALEFCVTSASNWRNLHGDPTIANVASSTWFSDGCCRYMYESQKSHAFLHYFLPRMNHSGTTCTYSSDLHTANEFVLRPGHWKVNLQDLLAAMPGLVRGHQALPVHVPSRLLDANSAREQGLSPEEIDEKVAEILRQCLDTHSGQFDPSWISHKKSGLKPDDERLYSRSRLNKLLAPGQLKSFVNKHPEFTCTTRPSQVIVASLTDPVQGRSICLTILVCRPLGSIASVIELDK